jgi:hypothetical protein
MMARTRETLIALATALAANREARLFNLQKELSEIERKKTETERAIHSARLAPKRLSDYISILGGDLFCPRCWIDNEARNLMSPKPSETSGIPSFRERPDCEALWPS